jgi:hypothetical protein
MVLLSQKQNNLPYSEKSVKLRTLKGKLCQILAEIKNMKKL